MSQNKNKKLFLLNMFVKDVEIKQRGYQAKPYLRVEITYFEIKTRNH